MLKLGFIGAGTTGNALAIRLRRAGYPVVAAFSRTRKSAEKLASSVAGCRAMDDGQKVADAADLVFITTPDDAIAPVAGGIRWRREQFVVHCSGAASTDILEAAKKQGASTGVFHPLQTFADCKNAVHNIPGSTFAIEAEEPLLENLKRMAEVIGGRWIFISAGNKVAYHIAAVIASNYLVTIAKLATDLWQSFGVSREEAVRSLLPLMRGTLHNIETIGLPKCLTGPIARGDIGTVQKHLAMLQQVTPDLIPVYKEMGRQTIPVALGKGRVNDKQARELSEIFKQTPA